MAIERQPSDAFAEKRYAPRKAVALTLRAWIEGAESDLTVRDLSNTGFLIETDTPLTLGQTIELELPHEGRKEAQVVWAGDALAGCTFVGTISKASISAALLKSEVLQQEQPPLRAPPIVYSTEDVESTVDYPMPVRLAVIGVGSVLAWIPLVLLGSAILA